MYRASLLGNLAKNCILGFRKELEILFGKEEGGRLDSQITLSRIQTKYTQVGLIQTKYTQVGLIQTKYTQVGLIQTKYTQLALIQTKIKKNSNKIKEYSFILF